MTSAIELIQGAGRVKQALLTTYALGLTFFESVLLPELRKAGCEQITVLADVGGYRSSLMEARARHVGRDYALIPVRVDGGIFHPKITYLVGDTEDTLIVGSGNLTFGGIGSNIEVLDVLRSKSDEAAFADFARWMDALTQSPKIALPTTQALSIFMAHMARYQPVESPSLGATRLISTFDGPVSEQLAVLASRFSETWDELLVLSPFHHASGKPVKALADALGVKRLSIGVPSAAGATSSFPYHLSADWGFQLRCVAPNVDGPERRLHAKWIELRGPVTLCLTGSINATQQALESVRNVEVGVLRQLPAPSFERWVDASPPPFMPDDFSSPDGRSDGLVYAELDGAFDVQGHLFGNFATARQWIVRLHGDDLNECAKVQVDDSGRFSWRLTNSVDLAGTEGVQLVLTCGGNVARGWLTISGVLALSSSARAAIGAAKRVADRSETTEDFAVLFDFISQQAHRIARQQPALPVKPAVQAGDAPAIESRSFSVTELFEARDTQGPGFVALVTALRQGLDPVQILALLIGQMVGQPKMVAPIDTRGRRDDDAEPEEEEGGREREAGKKIQERRDRQTLEAFLTFDAKMKEALQRCAPERAAPIIMTWGVVSLEMLVRRYQRIDRAREFAAAWLTHAVRSPLPDASRLGVDEMVCGLTALVGAPPSEPSTATVSPPLHRWLESYFQSEVTPAQVAPLAAAWLKFANPALLAGRSPSELVAGLSQALATPTLRSQLAKMIDDHREGRQPKLPSELSDGERRWLKWALSAPPARRRLVLTNPRTSDDCPECSVVLAAHIRSLLFSRGLAECQNCNRIIVSINP